MSLDVLAAQKVVHNNVARPSGLTAEEAAGGILAIMNNTMVGAGPLAADMKAEFTCALPIPGPVDQAAGDAIVADLTDKAQSWLEAEDVPDHQRAIQARALLRFHGQGGETAVDRGETPQNNEERFRQAHEALYGFVLESPIELITIRVEVAGRTDPVEPPALASASMPVPLQTQMVYWLDGAAETPIYDRAAFGESSVLVEPAILTQLDTTIIAPGWTAKVHASGALILKMDAT